MENKKFIYADVNRYDEKDNLIDTISCNFKELVSYDNFHKYYYRYAKYADTPKSSKIIHFNVQTKTMNNGYFSEADYFNRYLNYAVKEYYKNSGQYFYDEFHSTICRKQWFERRKGERGNVSREGFLNNLQQVLDKHNKLVEITDLAECNGMNGLYILVLDDINQCYVGQSKNIRQRIMKHWSRADYFTGTGIDLYCAKDTTRIYVCEYRERRDQGEYELIHEFRPDYLLNTLAGSLGYLLSESKDITLRRNEESREYNNFHEMLQSIFGPIRNFVDDNRDFLLLDKDE